MVYLTYHHLDKSLNLILIIFLSKLNNFIYSLFKTLKMACTMEADESSCFYCCCFLQVLNLNLSVKWYFSFFPQWESHPVHLLGFMLECVIVEFLLCGSGRFGASAFCFPDEFQVYP